MTRSIQIPARALEYCTSALLAMPAQRLHDLHSLLPPIWNAYSVPQATALGPYLPVPKPAVDRVREMLEELQYSRAVADAVDAVSIVQLRSDIRWLAGEDEDSPIVSRHSFAEGSRYAASWMKDIVETTGATCEVQPFLIGFAPNLICRYPAATNTTATVVLGAHYDSRGSFGSPRAPGADDNGSGTVGVLSIARLIGSKGIEFKSNVELALFAGEEQGLLGSKHYAKQLREVNKNVTFMLQADSVAYRTPGTQSQLGLPDLIGTPEAAQLVGNISNLYSPELHVGYTPVCCSDHQSFHEQGFPATWIYESAGPVIDPMYHNSGDLSDRIGYDFNQLRSAVKVMVCPLPVNLFQLRT
ncbi:Zn-dependent exopeptidase [Peniophora sp. CONT]|nr:Zn-dependent exopeptidase [Peniophora sp. CONT]